MSANPTNKSLSLKRKLIIFGLAIVMGTVVMGWVTKWQQSSLSQHNINWHTRLASPKIEQLYRSKKTFGLGDVSLVLLEHRHMPQQAALVTGLPSKTVDLILEEKLNKELLNTMLNTYQQWAGEDSSDAMAKKTVKIAHIKVLSSPNDYTRNLQVDLQVGTEPQPRQYKAELIVLSRQHPVQKQAEQKQTPEKTNPQKSDSQKTAFSKEALLVGFAQQDIFQKKAVDEMLALLTEGTNTP